MGLLDVLTGMRNGPRGGAGGFGGGGGGMSPILMAALGLLAYKAIKGFGSSQPQPQQQSRGANPTGAPAEGGLGGLLQSLGLGGAGAAGGGLGGILSGGLGDLVKQFQTAGKGDEAKSWVGTGPNKTIPPADLAQVLTPDQVEFLMEKTGLSREELLAGLSQELPEVVNELTPQGRLPSPQDFNRTA
ncbi:YidB family protein [soil metagenome]